MQSSNASTDPDKNDGVTSLPESNTIPDDIKQLILKLQRDRELRSEFELFFDGDRWHWGNFDEYGLRWLRDQHGRVISCEEQRQFNVDELREFIRIRGQQQQRKFVDL